MAKGNGLLKTAAFIAAIAGAAALLRQASKSRHGKVLRSAMDDAKTNVMAHAKRLGHLSKSSYANVVDTVLAEYANMKTLSKKEVAALSKDLKGSWEDAQKTLKKTKKA